MAYTEHDYTTEIVCPWCGNIYTDSSEYSPDDECIGLMECDECGKGFYATRNISITYSTDCAEYGDCKHCGKHDVMTSMHSSIGKYEGLCPRCGDKEKQRLKNKCAEELRAFRL
jgi:hypothetical protein